jgi:hypothetical protein
MICLRCLKPASLGCRRVHLNTKRLVYHLSRTTPTRLFGNLTIAGDHHGDAALPAPPRCLSGSESRRKAQTVRSRCNSSALALASYVGWGSFSAPNGVVLTSSSKLSRRARAAICGVRGWLPPLLFRSRLSTVLRARVSAAVSRPGFATPHPQTRIPGPSPVSGRWLYGRSSHRRLLRCAHKLDMAHRDRREVKAVSLDDAAWGVAS